MAKRPPIPADLERLVLLEAGHRCSIHACRQHPVEIAHIVPWSQCREHCFANLVALCPTCHTRYDRHEIDRKSMFIYKQNAWLSNPRYGDLEKRLLLQMAATKAADVWVFSQIELLLGSLLSDGVIIDSGETRPSDLHETLRQRRYILTASGHELVSLLGAFDSMSGKEA